MKAYGCIKDDPDDRDRNFLASWFSKKPATAVPFAAPLDLFPWFPPVMYQGMIGSCAVHATTTALRFNMIDNNETDVPLSRSQLYLDAGEMEGDTSDIGRQIRDVVKCAATTGVAPESMWPYDGASPWQPTVPPPEVYAAAQEYEALDYQRVDVSLTGIRTALFVGRPVIIGINIYEQFESDEALETGLITTPTRLMTPISRHAMVVGANGVKPGYSTVRNCWGLTAGVQGNCFIRDDYLGDPSLGSDYWVVFQNKDLPT